MKDDDHDQERSVDDREISDEQEEREYRRIEDHDEPDDATVVDTGVNDTSLQPNQPRPADTDATDEAGTGRDEEQLDVPQITVEHPAQVDPVKQAEDNPVDRTVKVPQIKTRLTNILSACNLDTVVLTETNTKNMAVPQFTPDTTHRPTPEELNDEQPEGIERVQQVQIPQVTVECRHRIRPFNTFLETVPDITAEVADTSERLTVDGLSEEKAVPETVESSEEATHSLDEPTTGDHWITGEWPDPLELLLGSGGTDIKSDNPIVILVDNDELVGVVETLVKRLYREKEGGEPDLKKSHTADQLADEERWLAADSQIFTAELSDEEWEQFEENNKYHEQWRSIWLNRFDQLFSGQRFGAIILNCRQIPGLEIVSLPHHPPTVVDLESGMQWKDVANVFWGSKPENVERAMTFSQVFDRDANGAARDRWRQILQSADRKFDLATDDDGTASDEHYALKVFIVKWLVEQLWTADREFTEYDGPSEIEDYREIEEVILTEQPVPVTDGAPVKPDILYESMVFEAEMFFDEDDESGIVSKLQQTVRKYEDVEQEIDTINIVVDNLTCILHLKDLAQFKRNHQHWENDYAAINLYTVDLNREKLVLVNKVVDELK